MEDTGRRAIAIVGVGAILPDAPDAKSFWQGLEAGRYAVSDVPPDRWDPALYYDADPAAPDKTYSRIGGWVRRFDWDPIKWKIAVPPRVGDAMDITQKWAVACTRAALADYGFPERELNQERTAVILGNAMAGELHYETSFRINLPEVERELRTGSAFGSLAPSLREAVAGEMRASVKKRFPEITEDTMPGELANCMAGRVANLFNFHGPNFVCDAACASAMAAMSAAIEGLAEHAFDVAVTGGIDRNMGAATFVKFCKIGALSATGSRPYADGADGFVMGEGAVVFLLKRLADAERDQDRIYAVLRGVAGASDGKGKGITAPNPVGQRLAIERAWQSAGLDPRSCSLVEGHGTSTRVGDVVEFESLVAAFGNGNGPAPHSIPLGSVKSNFGHLKGAAGAAGLLKAAFALHHKRIPPSLHFDAPNPNIDFAHAPFYVNTELRDWPTPACGVRRAGVSAFGFGGTNFHAVLEEHVPGRLTGSRARVAVSRNEPAAGGPAAAASGKAPLRGALVVGADTEQALRARLVEVGDAARAGKAPAPEPPSALDLAARERVAIDYASPAELADKVQKTLAADRPQVWKALRAQGIFRGQGQAPKVAFLYTGQGSQYVNMLRGLRQSEPIVGETFLEADRIMTPLLGRPLSDYVFVDPGDAPAVATAEESLKQTAVTQPAVLASDLAMTRLLEAYGLRPDMVMGHSLGEYGALVAAGVLSFADALLAVSARGKEMTKVSVADNGKMAAVLAPLAEVERVLAGVEGYVVVANYNSAGQSVIGGASAAVDAAVQAFQSAGINAVPLPVSHAFHTEIVAPASGPLREVLERLDVRPPVLPVVANVTGELYPTGPDARSGVLETLGRQVASPVQFVKGLRTLREAGVGVFVEVGPKKALHGFVEDVFAADPEVSALFTNHPKLADAVAFNQALCGLYAAGLGAARQEVRPEAQPPARPSEIAPRAAAAPIASQRVPAAPAMADTYRELGQLFVDFLDRGLKAYSGGRTVATLPVEPVVITGAGIGLPGGTRVFDDANVSRILRGEQLIGAIPAALREAMTSKHILRLVKSEVGEHRFELIDDVADVIKLAGRGGALDLEREFGVSAERVFALDTVTKLAIGAGLEALRDAGLPLVLRYKTTTKGTRLPDRFMLPEALRDETGVIFASAFPGLDSFADVLTRYHQDRTRRERLAELRELRGRAGASGGGALVAELDHRIEELEALLSRDGFVFDRRFLFRVLSMGHSQFAEHIGARGPNTQVNSACASTTLALGLAEDWIRAGRCRRVVVVSADDVTSDHLIEWIGSGFLASGAAATDEEVEAAATPFDRRRHGMIVGMGAAALVVESAEAARERGLRPIAELLGAVSANSAYHGTRLDVNHISQVMETLVAQAESRWGVKRDEMAPATVFVSHETYTPARGGSAAAEVHALRRVFRDAADRIVMANTKGFTGHAMGVGIEDVVAIKALETGLVPPIPNYKEVDPELGALNLSKGGEYPVRYALRLAAGFGSQISVSLVRWVPSADGSRRAPDQLGFAYRVADATAFQGWLARISGSAQPQLEVTQRTLRVKDTAAVKAVAVPAPVALPVPQATVAAAPAPEPAHVPTRPEASDPVGDRILALVSAKTGYPADMLALDLDLEADLGVDTVKQAELFASVREEWSIPRDENRKLRDYPTLGHVIAFVHKMRPDLRHEASAAPASAAAAPPAPAAPASAATVAATADGPRASDPVRERVLALVAEKTGYPPDMLDVDLDLEADLGVDTVKQAELFASVRETWGIPRDENRKLRDYPTLRHVIDFVYSVKPDLRAPAAAPSPVQAPAPSAQEAARVASAEGDDRVRTRILELVAEKTGYPPDMLDVDLDLEADLGVDTVKQAELFASVRETWDIPRDENRKLRDYPTLRHVIGFVHSMRPDLAPLAAGATTAAAAASAPPAAGTEPRPTAAAGLADLAAADLVPRRAAVPVVRPPLELCKPTGVTLGPGRRVLVAGDQGGVAKALVRRLEKLGVTVLPLDEPLERGALEARLAAWLAQGPIHGVYWLPALDAEGDFRAMDLAGWREALRVRVKLLHSTMRALYEQVSAPGTFLVAGTRMGGQHGYDAAGAAAPLGGAVAGFVKAYKQERPDALVKVVDFEPSRKTAEFADLLVEETLRDPGVVEVGYKEGLRTSVGLAEESAADGGAGLTLGKDSVFLVTGAAGAIVSAIVADLAAASGGTFHLFDVVPQPDPANPDIVRLRGDRDGLKRELAERLKAKGGRVTPALVEKTLAGLERAEAALVAIRAIEGAGGTVHYYSLDLRDAGAVARACASVVERSGRVDVLMHAAGLEVSRTLDNKEPGEFDLVFDVKADGWFNLLKGLGDAPIGATVAFSSIAGRFGNRGQTDYSAANDLLCKTTSSFRTTRPGVRGIAIDWTAWGDLGMATRGSIPRIMAEAGIDMLPAASGIPVIRRELTAGGRRGEIVIAGRLGVLQREWDETGGLDTSAVAAKAAMIGTVKACSVHHGLLIETVLDPPQQPFLNDHRIEGTPVLPGVMGIESFAEAAALILPGWHVADVEHVEFQAPFKFYRDEPRALELRVVLRPDAADVVADCRLQGSRTLPGQSAPQKTTHFTARVRLTPRACGALHEHAPKPRAAKSVGPEDIYRVYFHGPSYRVLEGAWRENGEAVGLLAAGLPADHTPVESALVMAPRLIELCFQTAGVLEMGTRGRMGLPLQVSKIAVLRAPEDANGERLFALVKPAAGGSHGYDARVVDEDGNVYVDMTGYTTVELPGGPEDARLEPFRTAMA